MFPRPSTGSSSLLVAHSLHFDWPDGSPLFRDINLAAGPGIHSLIGDNGAGKSTLLRLLAGELSPTQGSIVHQAQVALLPQRPVPEPDATVAHALDIQHVLEALTRVEQGDTSLDVLQVVGDWAHLPELAGEQLARLGLPGIALDRAIASLSGGEARRVYLAGLLLKQPDVLLLDEPTNHMDRPARLALFDLVATFAGTVVLASHDRELLALADETWELSSLGLRIYGGDYATYKQISSEEQEAAKEALQGSEQRLKASRRQQQLAKERQQRRMARGSEKAIREGLPAVVRGAMKRGAQVTMGRLKHAHADKVSEARTQVHAARERVKIRRRIMLKFPEVVVPAGKRLVELTRVNYTAPGETTPLWPVPLTLSLYGPARLAVTGPNGSGKTTLMRLIAGAYTTTNGATRGTITGDARTYTPRIAHLEQGTERLDENATLLANLQRAAPDRTVTELRELLGAFLFEQDAALKTVAQLSGGERLRGGLAYAMASGVLPDLLLLDEPTNDLDLGSLEELEDFLHDYPGALIVVSHDEAFLDRIKIERRLVLPSPAAATKVLDRAD